MEELRYWLALSRMPGLGAKGYAELLRHCDSPRAVFEAGAGTLLPRGVSRSYAARPDWAAVDRDLEWLGGGSQRAILTLRDDQYPAPLRAIPDPPPVLFSHGDISLLNAAQVAIVGSRNPSHLGTETARGFGMSLGRLGIVVTSGLAIGIDAAAHQGALAAGSPTIAVAGTGLDRVYPACHHDLAHRIVNDGGLLVSEYHPGTPPLPGNFPRRNRIISALSLGTLVVEAALKSGSLVTARLAMEQGREVFAVPGSIHNPLARGCHRLIREGAKLVETVEDILEELAPQLRAALREEQPEGPAEPQGRDLDEEHCRLLNCIGHEPCAVDLIVERSGLTPETVSSMLLQLELRGYVLSATGGYARTSKRI